MIYDARLSHNRVRIILHLLWLKSLVPLFSQRCSHLPSWRDDGAHSGTLTLVWCLKALLEVIIVGLLVRHCLIVVGVGMSVLKLG